MMTINILLKLM